MENFEKYFAEHEIAMRKICHSKFPYRHDVAQDLFQDWCIELWKRWEVFDPTKGEFLSWANARLVYVLLRLKKKNYDQTLKRDLVFYHEWHDDLKTVPFEYSEDHFEQIHHILQNADQEEALYLQYQGFSREDIAKTLKRKKKAVDNLLWRGKKKLKKFFEEI